MLLLPCGTSSQSRGAPQGKWHHLGCRRVPTAQSLTGERPGSCQDGRGGDRGGTLQRGSTVRGLGRGLCRQGRGRRRGEHRRAKTVTSSCISGLGYQRLNGAGGSKVPGKGQRKPDPAGKGELPEILVHNFFWLQPKLTRAASPRQLGAEAHALPCGAAETTQNIPPSAVGSKRNMTNRAAMRRKYCLNLYWNPFSNQANNSNTPGRLKNTVCISMESKGSFTTKSNEQMRQCHLVRNRPTGEKTETPFPSRLFLRLGFCSKSSHSLGFEGRELPWGW